jgi:hypothetical protein
MSRVDALLERLGGAVDELVTRSAWMRRWYVPVTAAGLTAIAIVAVFRMEATTPNYDPQYMRVLVERAIEHGGSYYSNGIHNKGPLEPLVYELAARLGGRDGWWFVIGVLALAAAVCVGLAAAVLTVRVGGSTLLGVCVAVLAIVHLTLSDADYAGVLYARNITTALIAGALGVAAYGPFWTGERRRRWAVIAIGVASGLAVQTLLTAAFTASPVLLWAMWERRHERVWGRPAWLAMPAVSAGAFLVAPLYYLTLGPWQDFVDGYWTHARFMSSGTGRSLTSQIELGWDRFVDYYGDRPALVVLLLAWLLVAGIRFRAMSATTRGLHLVVAVWWIGAWIELVLSQRYSSHYFSVLAVPTIMLIALLVGNLAPLAEPVARGRPAFALLPLLVAYVTIEAGGRSGFDLGIDTVAAVRSTADFAERREVGIDGRTRVIRATLDLVSEDGDPLLVWTSYPWPYLNLERTSATRYIWKTFLMGEIYLGGSGPQYVLPGTWEQFAADLDATDPTAYYVESVNPIDPSTPFRVEVDDRFTDVFVDDDATLGFRHELAAWLTEPVQGATAIPTLPDAPYSVSPDGCVRVDGRLSREASAPLAVEMTGANGLDAALIASVVGDEVVVESRPTGLTGWEHRLRIGEEPLPVSLIVGARSAALVVDGLVAGAVEIESGTEVTITSGVADLTRLGATISEPPAFTGC